MCMYIEALKQEMVIASQDEAVDLHNRNLRHWNIISITGRSDDNKPHFPNALSVCSLCFDDVMASFPSMGLYAAKPSNIHEAIEFSRQIYQQPLLIHCHAGISRSTALAWLVVFDKLKARFYRARRSFEIVRRLRPQMMPNDLILRLGVRCLIKDATERRQIQREFNHCLSTL